MFCGACSRSRQSSAMIFYPTSDMPKASEQASGIWGDATCTITPCSSFEGVLYFRNNLIFGDRETIHLWVAVIGAQGGGLPNVPVKCYVDGVYKATGNTGITGGILVPADVNIGTLPAGIHTVSAQFEGNWWDGPCPMVSVQIEVRTMSYGESYIFLDRTDFDLNLYKREFLKQLNGQGVGSAIAEITINYSTKIMIIKFWSVDGELPVTAPTASLIMIGWIAIIIIAMVVFSIYALPPLIQYWYVYIRGQFCCFDKSHGENGVCFTRCTELLQHVESAHPATWANDIIRTKLQECEEVKPPDDGMKWLTYTVIGVAGILIGGAILQGSLSRGKESKSD